MTNRESIAEIEKWLQTHTCIGAKCGNCEMPFTAAKMAKSVVGIPNGAGCSIYALCRPCARRLKRKGTAGIPNAVKDAKLATLLWFTPARGRA